jgi:hypothetical protein
MALLTQYFGYFTLFIFPKQVSLICLLDASNHLSISDCSKPIFFLLLIWHYSMLLDSNFETFCFFLKAFNVTDEMIYS